MDSLFFYIGEAHFLVREAVSNLTNTHTEKEVIKFENRFDLNELLDSISSISMFSPSRLIKIQSPWFLSAALSKGEETLFKNCIDALSGSGHVMVVYHFGSVDQRKKMVTLLKKSGTFEQFSPFKDWEQDKVLSWLKNRTQQLGLAIDQDALFALEQIGGTDLALLAGELDKLKTYIGDRTQITLTDVRSLSAGVSSSFYDLTEAVKKKDVATIHQTIHHLLSHGEDPIKLLGFLSSSLRLYFQLHALGGKGSSPQTLAKQLGKNPYFLQKLLPEVTRAYKMDELETLLLKICQTDIQIKSGKISPATGVSLVANTF